MTHKKQKPLVLKIWNDSEMAELWQGKKQLYMGNFWDFHAGCMGTKFTFEDGSKYDFKNEWTKEIRRPIEVAGMVSAYLKTTYKVKHMKNRWNG
jgi:hypothetical protein